MTQLKEAKNGVLTPEIKYIAEKTIIKNSKKIETFTK